MSKNGKIIIIGGGASGLAAALAAAKECGGRCVTVLERLDRVGKKLLATGNGRCNLTNRNAAPEHYHSADTARLADILERTPPDAVLDFFGEMGLLCDTQADGRVYPYCYQASMVLDVLRAALERAGVDVACSCEVAEVEKGPGGFSVRTLSLIHISRALGRELGLPVMQALCKIRETPRQMALSGGERRKNLKNAFSARPDALLEGKRILLVDDVLTTGSTLNECAKALRAAGAAECRGVCAAATR